jgi:hypothetical protein
LGESIAVGKSGEVPGLMDECAMANHQNGNGAGALSTRVLIYAQRKLASRGVEILTKGRVSGYTGGIVRLADGRSISARTLVWTAGNAGHPLVAALPLPNRGGRVAAAQAKSQVAVSVWRWTR